MKLLRVYLEISGIVKSFLYLVTFPFSIIGFGIGFIVKHVWMAILAIGLVQRLVSPRFGTNIFSRFGRILLINTNVHVFFGGAIAGVAIVFVLYQPMLSQFDGRYYVVFQQQGAPVALAAEAQAPVLDEEATFMKTSMPIVTTVAPTPVPTAAPRRFAFVAPQVPPADFVPPNMVNSGSYLIPLRNPPRLLITTRYSGYHPGIDLATELGTPIYAAAPGYVETVGSTIWAYGNVVYINHGNGVVTLYAHMSRVDVKPGQMVTKDTVIGAVGSTGNSSGPHVHFEIHKDGTPFNPQSIVQGL
jgi:hypothetical protein